MKLNNVDQYGSTAKWVCKQFRKLNKLNDIGFFNFFQVMPSFLTLEFKILQLWLFYISINTYIWYVICLRHLFYLSQLPLLNINLYFLSYLHFTHLIPEKIKSHTLPYFSSKHNNINQISKCKNNGQLAQNPTVRPSTSIFIAFVIVAMSPVDGLGLGSTTPLSKSCKFYSYSVESNTCFMDGVAIKLGSQKSYLRLVRIGLNSKFFLDILNILFHNWIIRLWSRCEDSSLVIKSLSR